MAVPLPHAALDFIQIRAHPIQSIWHEGSQPSLGRIRRRHRLAPFRRSRTPPPSRSAEISRVVPSEKFHFGQQRPIGGFSRFVGRHDNELKVLPADPSTAKCEAAQWPFAPPSVRHRWLRLRIQKIHPVQTRAVLRGEARSPAFGLLAQTPVHHGVQVLVRLCSVDCGFGVAAKIVTPMPRSRQTIGCRRPNESKVHGLLLPQGPRGAGSLKPNRGSKMDCWRSPWDKGRIIGRAQGQPRPRTSTRRCRAQDATGMGPWPWPNLDVPGVKGLSQMNRSI